MGNNNHGQLGLGFIPVMTNVPQQILSSGVATVACGANHSLFRMGGSLWTMGQNDAGQLGDGTTNNHVFPEKIFPGSGSVSVTAIATGPEGHHSLFATSGLIAGSTGLKVTGDNSYGELGDGALTNHDTPEQIVASAITAASCGFGFSMFVRSDGSLWSMGRNNVGELGNGTILNTNRPVQIVASGVTAVASGTSHTLFLKSDGSLWAMGVNDTGQLGDNTTFDQHTPEQVVFNGVTAVAAGQEHSLFIKSDGSLWGMGDNMYGQLGDGTNASRHLPIQIVSSNVVAVAAGGYSSLFIKSDGSLWGMGENTAGQLGDGSYTNHLTPIRIVAGLPPAPRITGISLAGANLNLTGANGAPGETLVTLTSTSLALPRNQWQPVATNLLNATGNFSIIATNAVLPKEAQRFFILQVQ